MLKKHKSIVFLFCFVVCFIYLFPQINLKQPNLLDITETWSFGTDTISNSINSFNDASRFRPVYIFERTILNSIFIYNNAAYFITFCALLSITLFLIILISNSELADKYSIIYIILLTLISPITVDTYWRLGTAENVFTLMLLLNIFFLTKKKYLLLTLSLIILMGAKETSILYIPLFLISLIILKRYKEVFFLSICYTLFVTKIIALVLYANNHPFEYTALYSKSIVSLCDMFAYYVSTDFFYIIIFLISVFLLVLRIGNFFRISILKKIKFEIFLIATILIGMISIILFVNKGQPYYFFPTMATIFLFYFWELKHAQKIMKNISIILIMISFFLLKIPFYTLKQAIFWNNDYTGDGVLIDLVKKTKKENTYKFNKSVREEYVSSLNFLYYYDNYHEDQFQKIKDSTKLINPAQTDITGIKLCGKSFFGETVCKWTIQNN